MTQGGVRIELRGVVKSYDGATGGQQVLRGVDATIEPGEFVVVVGRSGSGKSTLLNLIGGLDVPSAGDILLDGASTGALDETARALLRRRRLGFVFQFFNLIPTLTVLENLLLPLELNGIIGPRAETRARELLAEVGLAERAHSLPEELSGGEQQRVALARALVHDPGLVLADEPTGNLDLDTARRVLNLLDALCRRRAKTLVMATHSAEVIGVADRVLRIHEGRIEAAR